MSTLLDHPLPTLPPPPPPKRGGRGPHVPQWSKRTWQILAGLVALVFVFGMWLFYFSSVFALESLVVEGVRTVNPTDVGQRADLGAGTPLARVNPDDVEARVMGLSAVQSVQVTRRWPNMIVISVVERDRVAALKDGDRWATLDAQGFAFEFAKKKPQGLPVVEAAEGPARTAASRPCGEDQGGFGREPRRNYPDDILRRHGCLGHLRSKRAEGKYPSCPACQDQEQVD